MATAILAAIPMILQLVIMILSEVFSAKKKADEEKRRFDLDEKLRLEIMDKAVEKFKKGLIERKKKDAGFQDELDKELKDGSKLDRKN